MAIKNWNDFFNAVVKLREAQKRCEVSKTLAASYEKMALERTVDACIAERQSRVKVVCENGDVPSNIKAL